jgi:hypothetical protein
MARGWESKSVEQQQQERLEQPKGSPPVVSAEQRERNRKQEGLVLSRKHLTQQLEAARHPRHRKILAAALADLDRQLASFK